MKTVDFPYRNVDIAKDQPEYKTLPALVVGDEKGTVISCWEMTDEELEQVKKTKRIYLSLWTFGQPLQPQRLATDISDFFELTNNEKPEPPADPE